MLIRDSDLPEEQEWNTYFDPPKTLTVLGLNEYTRDVVDVGCGYGTFTIPAAEIIRGKIYAIDIDPAMIQSVEQKAKMRNLGNIVPIRRDFVSEGSGLEDSSIDYVMFFNILHAENPENLLKEAYRILRRGGRLGIVHWNYDETVTMGPSMDIRPKPEQCRQWAETVGFNFHYQVDLKPYHYGIVMRR